MTFNFINCNKLNIQNLFHYRYYSPEYSLHETVGVMNCFNNTHIKKNLAPHSRYNFVFSKL